jgi:hypothetical protein
LSGIQKKKYPPLDWDIHVSEVMENEVDESFVTILANEVDERL